MDDSRRKQLDTIVSQMDKNGEKPENIQLVVNDFKKKYSAQPKKEDMVSSLFRTLGLGVVPDASKQVGGILGATAGGAEYGLGKLLNNQGMQQQGSQIYQPAAQVVSDTQSKFGFASPESGQTNQLDAGKFATQSSKDAAGAALWLSGTGGVAPKGASTLMNILGHAPTGVLRGALASYAQDNATPQSVATGAAIGGVSEPAIAGLGALLKGASKIRSPGAVANETTKRVTDVVGRNDPVPLSGGKDSLQTQIETAVDKKYGMDRGLRKALNDFISTKTPVPPTNMQEFAPGSAIDEAGNQIATQVQPQKMIGNNTLNELDLLKLRRNIGADVGYGATPRSSDEVKVANVARGVITSKLKEMVPEIKNLDKVATVYGNAPQYAKKGAIGLGLYYALKGILGHTAAQTISGYGGQQ